MNEQASHHALAEIARLRDIAEDGRRLPLANGRYLVLWGCAIALALSVQWIITMRWWSVPPDSIALTWPAILLEAAVLSRRRLFRRSELTGALRLGARVERTVWIFGGGFLALAPASLFLAAALEPDPGRSAHVLSLFGGMPALTFGVYAIALAASADIAEMRRLKPFALLSLAFVPVSLLLAGSVWQFPVVALGIVLVSVVPGILMLAAERAHRGR